MIAPVMPLFRQMGNSTLACNEDTRFARPPGKEAPMADSASAQALFPVVCIGYVLFASVLTYLAFRCDCRRAMTGQARVPEATLLALTVLGGSLGAKAAEWRLDDPDARPAPFKAWVNLIVAAQIVGVMALMSAPADGVESLASTVAPGG
jgi:uncharacterized membrane protein YsdA (DUF1294 family)